MSMSSNDITYQRGSQIDCQKDFLKILIKQFLSSFSFFYHIKLFSLGPHSPQMQFILDDKVKTVHCSLVSPIPFLRDVTQEFILAWVVLNKDTTSQHQCTGKALGLNIAQMAIRRYVTAT